MRKFVQHPETGQPVEEVVTFQGVELSQLQESVDAADAALKKTDADLSAANGRVSDLESQRDAEESALEEAKSDLEAYQELAPEPGTDSEPATDSGEVAAGAEDESSEPSLPDDPDEGESGTDGAETPVDPTVAAESDTESTDESEDGAEKVDVKVADDDPEF